MASKLITKKSFVLPVHTSVRNTLAHIVIDTGFNIQSITDDTRRD